MDKCIEFKPIYLPENKGLGNALREAVKNCTYSLIARMDSDDISAPDRFELQLNQFSQNYSLDIVGGNITEFVGEPNNITGQRAVLSTDSEIKKDMRKRCAMNHMAVMYKKCSVQNAGGYLDWPWNEDYYLWIRMIERGCTFGNIQANLVNVRTGDAMSARRGGWKYFKSEERLQRYMLSKQMISFSRYLYNVAIRFAGEVVATNSMRSRLFKFTRKEYVPDNSKIESKDNICGSKKKDYPPFSVSMCVYGGDKAEWFDTALGSVIDQTVPPDEIVLVVDGAIPESIQLVIDKYISLCNAGWGKVHNH